MDQDSADIAMKLTMPRNLANRARPAADTILNQWCERAMHAHDGDVRAAAGQVADAMLRAGGPTMWSLIATADELTAALRPLVRDFIQRRGTR